MNREEKRIKVRNILQDFYRRGEYELEQATDDVMCLITPLPPAEGAEENRNRIDGLIKKHISIDTANFEFCAKNNTINGSLLQGIRDVVNEFATLHAQRIAEKMVKDMRQKLFSMRSSKEPMYRLSEADRLMMYGYHDCINEMLMWTKPREI